MWRYKISTKRCFLNLKVLTTDHVLKVHVQVKYGKTSSVKCRLKFCPLGATLSIKKCNRLSKVWGECGVIFAHYYSCSHMPVHNAREAAWTVQFWMTAPSRNTGHVKNWIFWCAEWRRQFTGFSCKNLNHGLLLRSNGWLMTSPFRYCPTFSR